MRQRFKSNTKNARNDIKFSKKVKIIIVVDKWLNSLRNSVSCLYHEDPEFEDQKRTLHYFITQCKKYTIIHYIVHHSTHKHAVAILILRSEHNEIQVDTEKV